MTHKNEEETVVDAQMHHPFRCLVAGPSQSGKSTFVRNLLLRQNDIIDVCFDYVTIVLGTDAHKNEILSSLKDELRPGVVEIIELKKLYKTAELMKQNFCSEFEHFVKDKANKKKKGAGPSQSGKSTFVRNLLLRQNDIIDVCFDYVTIVLGTDAHKNEILSSLKDELRPGVVEIIELKKLYKTAELMKQNFCSEFEHFVKDKANKKKKGCVIFDDLMSELSECGLLLDLFSKYSSQ